LLSGLCDACCPGHYSSGVPSEADIPVKTCKAIAELTRKMHDGNQDEIKRPGLRIHPMKGRAVIFWWVEMTCAPHIHASVV
jgi:hypothetical protein